MKKLTILVALILCVTIGGVYATWTYSGAISTSSHMHMSVNLATATETNPKGTITNVHNSMDVLIDDGGSYTAVAKFSGKMGFIFTPAVGADSDVVANGITFAFAVEQKTPIQYDGNNIFNVTVTTPTTLTNGTKITSTNATTLAPGQDLNAHIGSFYIEITAEQVADCVEIASITLPTYTDYENFEDALVAGGALGVTVSEAP